MVLLYVAKITKREKQEGGFPVETLKGTVKRVIYKNEICALDNFYDYDFRRNIC